MPAPLSFGDDIPDDTVLRLCGELGGGRRVLELGASENSLVVARFGGKAIAVDPDASHLRRIREQAAVEDLHVECHEADLADLGFLPSASVELVVANHTVGPPMDVNRVLRQAHRVLRPGTVFVSSIDHPFAAVSAADGVAYGRATPTLGEWYTMFERANFHVDRLEELGADDGSLLPTTLVVRAHKEGS